MVCLSYTGLALLLEVSVKSLLLAGLAGAVLVVLRVRNTNVRHRVWTGVLLGMLVLPLAVPVTPGLPLPAWLVPALPPSDPGHSSSRLDWPPVAGVGGSHALRESPREAGQGMFEEETLAEPLQDADPLHNAEGGAFGRAAVARANLEVGPRLGLWPVAVFAAYVCGLAVFVSRFLIGLLQAARLTRRTRPIPPERLGISAGDVRATARVAVFECPSIRVPVTVGSLWPKILLPPQWRTWSKAKCRSVLAHELAHVRRGDYPVTLLAQLNRCLYWFHPLASYLCRRLSRLAEQSCDDAVIATSGDRPQYARHLLEVAGALAGARGRLIHAAGIPMARRCSVETRIAAILDAKRPLSGRVGRLSSVVLIAVLVPMVLFAAALRPSSQSPSDAAEETARAPADPGDTRDESPPSPPEAPTAPEVKVIRGTVVDESGSPVAGAEVWYPIKWTPGLDSRLTLHAESDQQGRFELEYPAARLAEERPTALFYSIWAHKSGRCVGTCSAYKALRAKEKAPEVEIVLGPETDASFIVVAPDGEPVAGAVAEPFHYQVGHYDLFPPELAPRLRATTDADGHAALPAVARDRLGCVSVTSKEFGVQHLDIYSGRTVPAEFTIPLQPVGRIEGRVIADEPEMARGVTIHLITEEYDDQLEHGQTEGHAKVVSDAEGRFSVPAMAAGRLQGLARWDKSLPFRPRVPEGLKLRAGQTKQMEVRIVRAVLAKGIVRTQDTKEPVAGVEISIGYGTYRQSDRVTSDEEGKFSTYVLPGYVRMHAIFVPDELVQLPGSQTDRYEVPAGMEQFDLPPLELLRCQTITGRLIDREGRPIAGAQVTAIRNVPHSSWVCGHGQTDEDGRFTMKQFPRTMTIEEALYYIRVPEQSRLEVRVLGTAPLVLQPPTSETGTVLEGRVVDQLGLPVPGAMVMPTCKADTGSRPILHGTSVLRITTDAQGRFQSPEPVRRDGSYGVEVSLHDKLQLALGRSPWIEATAKTTSFGDVTVKRSWCLRGTVRNEAGQPVAGAEVTHRFDADTITTHVTDAKGRFLVPGVFAYGRFSFSVTAPGYDDFDGHARLEGNIDREEGGVELVLRRKAVSSRP